MPNLVGIGNSQVPTNAMLGGLAYRDSVGEIVIDKIRARTFDTAVDIFVYDTRKDSDGGAWRHRTQNKSWYDEGVSATRGARKEFPAVVVIVAESTTITIYDGDDPNLPLWMKFNAGSGGDKIFNRPQYWNNSAVFALNGIICASNLTGSAESTLVLNFVNDSVRLYPISGYPTYGGDYTLGISGRSNSSGSFITISQNIVGDETFDVAMTVLPNATIDASTELPVPTIAVGTGHGVSVIKDDGTVVDLTYQESTNNQVPFLDIDSNGRIYWSTRKSGNIGVYFHEENLPTSDTNAEPSVNITLYQAGVSNAVKPTLIKGLMTDAIRTKDRTVIAISGDNYVDNKAHLNLYNTIGDVNSSGSVDNFEMVDISTDYNTGYIIGDIKGAFLSSTDDTNLTSGNNIVNNGTFDSNVSGWYGDSGAAVSWDSGGFALVTNGGGDNTYAIAQSGILVVGKKYRITGRVNPAIPSGSYEFRVRAGGSGTSWNKTSGLTNGSWYSFDTGVVTADGVNLEIGSIGGNITSFYIDDVVVKKFDDDRSVKNNGLEVFGTITKTPVATGAELVSYDSLTSSNYLEQPYNSDLDFGTGDFCMMGWFYNVGTSASILYRLHNSTSAGIGYIVATSSGGELGYSSYTQGFSSSGRITHYTSDTWNGKEVWNMFVCGKKGGYGFMYVNGVLKETSANANSHTDTTYQPPLRIGNNHAGNGGIGGGKLALIRISSSFPSEEQIKKIYNDEKCLFHENAKCTLYGTSNAITALAYDDTTNVLHVGTSAGRSEFRGLNRINNTTTAVTTAISASNELVAEQ